MHYYFLQVERQTWEHWSVIAQATVLLNYLPAPFEEIVRLVDNNEWVVFAYTSKPELNN